MKVSHMRAHMTMGTSTHQTCTHAQTQKLCTQECAHIYMYLFLTPSMVQRRTYARFKNSCEPVPSKNMKFVASQAKTKGDQRD